jgi:flagellar export protein FliJ
MRFQFRLEKMLNFIRIKETVKKMEVAVIVQKMGFLSGQKENLDNNIRALLEKSQSSLSVGMDWIYYQNSKIEFDLKETRKIEALLAAERKELVERKSELSRITMRKKALESLKEKRLKEFRLQQGRRVQKQLDDVYQLTVGRRRS